MATSRTVESLAAHLAGRDVRAIVRGQLDGKTFWVLFGPGDRRDYSVDNYIRKRGKWEPGGESFSADGDESSGWDMLGVLFVRAFTME
ncbi:MAG TPA: hypothetical protein VKC57_11685 [Ktedonobacterales bacterium]|nr:hypothetical protein [Ktedonobacterales bacterium]